MKIRSSRFKLREQLSVAINGTLAYNRLSFSIPRFQLLQRLHESQVQLVCGFQPSADVSSYAWKMAEEMGFV